jgi:hypothetical protein
LSQAVPFAQVFFIDLGFSRSRAECEEEGLDFEAQCAAELAALDAMFKRRSDGSDATAY